MKKITLVLFKICWIIPVRLIKLKFVVNYQQLYQVAVWEINQLSLFGSVVMVSAPLFSGGAGNFHKNLSILNQYIKLISSDGEIVWSQIPYLDINVSKWANIHLDTSKKINEFYVPIIRSQRIKKLICTTGITDRIPDYYDSLGCKTERQVALESNVQIEGKVVLILHNIVSKERP